MKDFKTLPKMKCGGKVKKYETGGKVYLGPAPEEKTKILTEKPADWDSGTETGPQKLARKVGEGLNKFGEALGATRVMQEKYNELQKKKRGGKVTKKKK